MSSAARELGEVQFEKTGQREARQAELDRDLGVAREALGQR